MVDLAGVRSPDGERRRRRRSGSAPRDVPGGRASSKAGRPAAGTTPHANGPAAGRKPQGVKAARLATDIDPSSSRPPEKKQARPAQVLSFADEEDEEETERGAGDHAAPGFSLSASTAIRFKKEQAMSTLQPKQLPPDRPFRWQITHQQQVANGRAGEGYHALGHLHMAAATARGSRPYMEDRHAIVANLQPRTGGGQAVQDGIARSLMAVFDGHCGGRAAELCSTRLPVLLAAEPALRSCTGTAADLDAMRGALTSAFQAVDEEVLQRCRAEGTRDGATGLVVLRIGQVLITAHCGDSRAVLGRRSEALALTVDHKPELDSERERIQAAGGRIEFQRCWRVILEANGSMPATGLAVSRAFGDPAYKDAGLLVATPDVGCIQLEPGDSCIVLGSDGIFDVLASQDVIDTVQAAVQAYRTITGSTQRWKDAAQAAATAVVDRALECGSSDNLTAVVALPAWS